MWYYGCDKTTTSWQTWTSNTATTSTGPQIWYDWNGTSTACSSDTHYYASDYSWDRWNPPENVLISSLPSRTLRETREREERSAYAVTVEQKVKAQRVAEQLLLENMTPDQREMYEKTKRFHVISSEGKRFEVDCNGRRYHNVNELNAEGKRIVEHCIYQRGGTPLGDNYLAQKLLLECDEKEFRRIANQTQLIG